MSVVYLVFSFMFDIKFVDNCYLLNEINKYLSLIFIRKFQLC